MEFVQRETVHCRANGQVYNVVMQDADVIDKSDIQQILTSLDTDGFVVINNVSNAAHRADLVQFLGSLTSATRKGWPDLCHHDAILELRQDPALVALFRRILPNQKLMVTFENAIHWKEANKITNQFHPRVDEHPEQTIQNSETNKFSKKMPSSF